MTSRIRTWWSRRVDRALREQHARLLADPALATRPHPWRVVVVVLTVAVHLVTLAVAGIAVAVWWTSLATVVKVGVCVVGGGIALLVSPLGLPRRPPGVPLATMPELEAIVREVATEVGTAAPRRVLATPGHDVQVAGRGRHRRLEIGLALWHALGGEARVAALAHALAREVVADPRRNLAVSWAVSALADWRYLLRPDFHGARRRGRRAGRAGFMRPGTSAGAAELALPVVLAPLTVVVLAADAVFDAASVRIGQRASYAADSTAVTVAGTEGLRALLLARMVAPHTRAAVRVALQRDREVDVLAQARRHLDELDPTLVARWRTSQGEQVLQMTDGEPPAVLCEQFATRLQAPAPRVTVAPQRWAAADAELAEHAVGVRAALRAQLAGDDGAV